MDMTRSCLLSCTREILGSSVDLGEGPPQQRTCFAELSAECHRRLATLRKRKQRVNVQKKPRGQEENERKC